MRIIVASRSEDLDQLVQYVADNEPAMEAAGPLTEISTQSMSRDYIQRHGKKGVCARTWKGRPCTGAGCRVQVRLLSEFEYTFNRRK